MAFGEGLASIRLEDDARIYGALVGGSLPDATSGGGGPLGGGGLLGGLGGGLGQTLGLLDLGTLLNGVLGSDGGVLGALSAFRRPMLFSLSDAAGVFHSEEALARVHVVLPGTAGTARTVLLNEQFGMAATP